MDLGTMPADITDAIKRISTQAAREQMEAELAILVGRHNAAGATPAEQAEVEARLMQLRRDAEIAARVSLWSSFSQALVLVVIGAYFLGIWLYLYGLGSPLYSGVDATRSVLVFTLSVAMLGFGGLLMVSTLYSSDDIGKMRERFRNAREVFLAFSGIFGTIIGFYFGTVSGSPADPPTIAGVSVGLDGTVIATVSKGRAPFTGRIRLLGGDDLSLAPTDVANQLSVRLDPARDCAAGAVVMVADGDARRAEKTVEQSAATLLQRGWLGCAGQAGSGNNASGNNAQTNQ
jgi:hypothetical protein